jgi:hypothetical protein
MFSALQEQSNLACATSISSRLLGLVAQTKSANKCLFGAVTISLFRKAVVKLAVAGYPERGVGTRGGLSVAVLTILS